MTTQFKLLFTAAECAPFAKVGGLADVAGSLAEQISSQQHDVRVVMPLYKNISQNFSVVKVAQAEVTIEDTAQQFELFRLEDNKFTAKYYFIKHKFFDSSEVYWEDERDNISNKERFVFFSKAVMEIFPLLKWWPDVIHCHDWHTALIPEFVDTYNLDYTDYPNIKTLLTIHNLANQGVGGLSILDYANLTVSDTPSIMEDALDDDQINIFKLGILSADKLNTVSPTYAKEVMTKQYGAGLEKFLQRRKKDFSGILNGIDVEKFNPQTDKQLWQNYNHNNWQPKKKLNKQKLQHLLDLEQTNKTPLFGMVSRLDDQKGVDLLIDIAPKLSKLDLQLVVLGTGRDKYEQKLKQLDKQYSNITALIEFDLKLARKIFAGSDVMLVPSKFEPCGLTQMLAMRYGSLPLVRKTGGLTDTVDNNKTGFVFTKYDSTQLLHTIQSAVKKYNSKKWASMVNNAMQADWSWKKSSAEYIKLYKSLIE